jgi:hypothetical protein
MCPLAAKPPESILGMQGSKRGFEEGKQDESGVGFLTSLNHLLRVDTRRRVDGHTHDVEVVLGKNGGTLQQISSRTCHDRHAARLLPRRPYKILGMFSRLGL